MLDLSLKAIANNLKDVRQQVSEHQEFKNALESLDELILNVNAPLNIMVMGEFSTGKSTFINAILKKEVVKMNSLPTTAVITKLCYGAKDKLIVHFKNGTNKEYNSLEFERLTATEEGETNEFHKTIDYVERLLPIDALKFMTIIDSPGTNAIRKEDEATTYRFINNVDTIFSLYAADQLDKQSENILLSSLNDRLKPIAIINKIDDLNEEEDDDIDVIIAEQKEKWKDKVQEIIGVSAKMALEGYLNNNRTFVQESRIEDFYKVLNDIVIPNRNKYKTNTLMDKLGEVFFLMGKAIHDIEKNNKESSKDNYEIYINKQMTLYPILDKIAQVAKPVYEYSRENQDKATSKMFLGVLYNQGILVERDSEKAVRYLEEASVKNVNIAQWVLAMYYIEGKEEDKGYYWIKKLAKKNDVKAQYMLGIFYLAKEDEESKNEGIEWLIKSAEQNCKDAQLYLGKCYENGIGVTTNIYKALEWYKRAAEQGLAEAQNCLGLCYDNGRGIEENKELAVEWYKRAAEQGYDYAQYNLGYCYDNGDGIQQDKNEAFKWYKEAAEQGLAVAQNKIGICYQDGVGIEQDNQEAVKWYKKAAEQGYDWAQYNLGCCYDSGDGIYPENKEKAFIWYKKAAEQGLAIAQNIMGIYYQKGISVEQNKQEAVKWFERAAEQGYGWAQLNLGYCYDVGNGIYQDKKEAFKWLKKAAEQGISSVQNEVGIRYEGGIGVEQNTQEAFKWFKKAAEQSYEKAQYKLAEYYRNGEGTEQDEKQAFKWFKLLADKDEYVKQDKETEHNRIEAQYLTGCYYREGKVVKKDKKKAREYWLKAAVQGHLEARQKLDQNKHDGGVYIGILISLVLMIGIGWLFVLKEQHNNSLDKDKDTIRTEEQYNTPVKKESNQNAASDLSLAGISLGDDIDKMYAVLGRERQIKHQGKYTFYLYDNVQVGMENGIVKALVSNNRLAETKRGIHEGSGLEDVFYEYGNDYYETDYNELILYEYTFPNQKGILRFAVNKSDNRVNYISVRIPDEDISSQSTGNINNNDIEGAKKALIMYYSCLAGDNFGEKSDAYNLLSDDMKNHMGSLDNFVASYRSTRNNDVTNIQIVSSEPNRVVLGYSLKSTDSVNNNSGLKVQYFKGTMTLSKETGNWRIVDLSVQND